MATVALVLLASFSSRSRDGDYDEAWTNTLGHCKVTVPEKHMDRTVFECIETAAF